MKRLILAIALAIPVIGIAQDHCPSFRVTKQRSGMHYELKKYKPKKMPRGGIVVFGGYYSGLGELGGGSTLRAQMIEYGFSAGWDVRTTNPDYLNDLLGKASQNPSGNAGLAYTNAYGATVGKYFILGGRDTRGLIDVGLGYGHSGHSHIPNKIPAFGYGLASYRLYRDLWVSGSIHVTDFQSTPRFSIGLATLVW